jgi:ADP-ribosyl-[dinitrogen reductase] hydrolase
MSKSPGPQERFRGILLGTAVGDALGLPAEGISRRRAAKMFQGRRRHRFVFGHGLVSDDTDHTIFVAQSLLAHPDSANRFLRRLAWSLRAWLFSLPAAVGFATLRSILRLWIGIHPARSGVFSAGNGPAMRVAPIGGFFAASGAQMDEYLAASTRITHTDPKALTGAKAIAYVTGWTLRESLNERPSIEALSALLRSAGTSDDRAWTEVVERIHDAHGQGMSVEEFAAALGLSAGVTGYVHHTVPVVVYAWYTHFGDFERTLSAVLSCGGDTDTTGAIAGALAGAVVGERGIPRDWLVGIIDWPRGTKVLRAIADGLAESSQGTISTGPVRYFWPGTLPRTVFFLAIVLTHAFRRLLPPY